MLMKEEIISMTNKELIKLEIIQKVHDKRITQVQASEATAHKVEVNHDF
jgi:hypothetical protein